MSGFTSTQGIATNPLIGQGTLNRIIGSVTIANYPQLNVTAPFLGKGGIVLSPEGNSTTYVPTMTGAVTSPEPYLMCSVTLNLLRTQNLAVLYKQQMENDARIGDFFVTPDTQVLPAYNIKNASIMTVREMAMNGEDAGFVITLHGYYLINNNLFNLTS